MDANQQELYDVGFGNFMDEFLDEAARNASAIAQASMADYNPDVEFGMNLDYISFLDTTTAAATNAVLPGNFGASSSSNHTIERPRPAMIGFGCQNGYPTINPQCSNDPRLNQSIFYNTNSSTQILQRSTPVMALQRNISNSVILSPQYSDDTHLDQSLLLFQDPSSQLPMPVTQYVTSAVMNEQMTNHPPSYYTGNITSPQMEHYPNIPQATNDTTYTHVNIAPDQYPHLGLYPTQPCAHTPPYVQVENQANNHAQYTPSEPRPVPIENTFPTQPATTNDNHQQGTMPATTSNRAKPKRTTQISNRDAMRLLLRSNETVDKPLEIWCPVHNQITGKIRDMDYYQCGCRIGCYCGKVTFDQ